MKRIISALLAIMLLIAPTLAAETGENELPYVIDVAGILTDDEWSTLEARAEEVAETYFCAVYVVIVDDYRDYGDGDVFRVATGVYDANGLGYGANRDGIMLFMSMDDRDYALDTYGYGSVAVTEYGNEVLSSAFLDNFRNNDWYGGFSDYIETSAELLSFARNGAPVTPSDPDYSFDGYVSDYGADNVTAEQGPDYAAIAICFLVGAVVAGIFVAINASKMKTAREATEASLYVAPGSFNVYRSSDIFTHITQTRRRIETDSGSRGGGGGGGGGGHSGHSGKF